MGEVLVRSSAGLQYGPKHRLFGRDQAMRRERTQWSIFACGSDGSVAALLPELQEVVRSRSAELIAAAYEDIAVENAAALLGLDANAARDYCTNLGWTNNLTHFFPCPNAVSSATVVHNLQSMKDMASIAMNLQ